VSGLVPEWRTGIVTIDSRWIDLMTVSVFHEFRTFQLRSHWIMYYLRYFCNISLQIALNDFVIEVHLNLKPSNSRTHIEPNRTQNWEYKNRTRNESNPSSEGSSFPSLKFFSAYRAELRISWSSYCGVKLGCSFFRTYGCRIALILISLTIELWGIN